MEPLQPSPLGLKNHSPWSNLHTVGISLINSCAHAGFFDWAAHSPRRRPFKLLGRRRARQAPSSTPPKYIRRLFIWGVIGINTAVTIAWARAVDEAHAAALWPGLWRARGGSSIIIMPSLDKMVRHFSLSAGGLREGRWWTVLTSSFSHAAPAHLLANMCGFYMWASRCFDLGLGLGNVATLMLGSSVCGGFAWLAGGPAGGPVAYVGASDAVCGLMAAAVLLEPVMAFDVPRIGEFYYTLFVPVLLGCATDVFGTVSQRHGLTKPSLGKPVLSGVQNEFIGHAAHLGGTAFGVAYWLWSLRPRYGTW
ncbi:hypothetical protein Daus18300_014085 [Diaporthe australafricana]|uniref:Peptidase S54 rhomboid domain-containing protein n=1 Tax=Diaporthe australafricana TaxID=127596 RepID=A0ABR3VWT4_9PEZI